MFGYSRKALQKPTKGGAPNVWFVEANIEDLPSELEGMVSAVSIFLPWGSLLKSVVAPDINVLRGLRQVCRESAELRIILSLDAAREERVIAGMNLPSHMETLFNDGLSAAYSEAGFSMEMRSLDKSLVQQIPTTWAKKLSFGGPRVFYEIAGAAK